MTHQKNISYIVFQEIVEDEMPFIIIWKDAIYRTGDNIRLKEWKNNELTGNELLASITYVPKQSFGLKDRNIALGIKLLNVYLKKPEHCTYHAECEDQFCRREQECNYQKEE